MELQHTEEYKPSGDVDSTFNLVSKLVTEMFMEEDEELVITAKSGEFFHDSSTSVEVVDPVKIFISSAGFTETGFRTVITMSGTFKSQYNEKYTFSLYFIMKRKIPVIPRKGTHAEKLTGQYLTLSISPPSKKLYDSLFSLTLECLTCQKNSRHFGEGKGYLVFGRYM